MKMEQRAEDTDKDCPHPPETGSAEEWVLPLSVQSVALTTP